MDLIEIIFLAGAQCVSPLQTADGITEANKVACAVMVKQDQETSAIEIVPSYAATNPNVIALLGRSIRVAKPRPIVAEIRPASAAPEAIPVLAQQVAIDQAKQAEHVGPAAITKVRMSNRQKLRETAGLTVGRKKTAARKLPDKCGSYKAVWYTNKEGRRKYRCVRG